MIGRIAVSRASLPGFDGALNAPYPHFEREAAMLAAFDPPAATGSTAQTRDDPDPDEPRLFRGIFYGLILTGTLWFLLGTAILAAT